MLTAKRFDSYVKLAKFFLKGALTLWLTLLFIAIAIQKWSGIDVQILHQAAAITLCIGLLGYAVIKGIQFCFGSTKLRFLILARVPLSLCFGLAGMNIIWEESKSIWPFICSPIYVIFISYIVGRRCNI